MIGENITIPDYTGKATCFRTWELQEGKLRPYYKRSEAWEAQVNQAVCKATKSCQDSPSKECRCGLYGFHELSKAASINCGVIGVTEHWGKTELHQDGLRSQYAQIKALTCASTPAVILFNFFKAIAPTTTIQHISLSIQLWISILGSVLLPLTILSPEGQLLSSDISNPILYNAVYVIFFAATLLVSFLLLLILLFPIHIGISFLVKRNLGEMFPKRKLKQYCEHHNIIYAKDLEELKTYNKNSLNEKHIDNIKDV